MSNNMEKKVTKAMKFDAVATYFSDMDADMVIGSASVKSGSDMVKVDITAHMIVEAMNHEVGLLTKKTADSGKLTKLQQENQKLTEAVYDGMEVDKQYTITDIIKSIPAVAGLNTSKVRPLLTPLMNDGRVVREEGKGGRPFFTKVK